MKTVLRSIGFGFISVFLVTACSDEDESKPIPQPVVVAAPEPEPEPELPIPEPIVPETVAVEVPEVAEVVPTVEETINPEVIAVIEEPVTDVVAEDPVIAEFRSGINSAVTNIGKVLDDGGWMTVRTIDTSSCLSEDEGEYRKCATKTVRSEVGFEEALFYTILWDTDSYLTYYQVP